MRLAALASGLIVSGCTSFSPDGGMRTVAAITGESINQNVVKVSSEADEAWVQQRVRRLNQGTLSADAAVQIALLNNRDLQGAYNRLGIAEAIRVKQSRPIEPTFIFNRVSTALELDIEREIAASVLSLLTQPMRAEIATAEFERAQLRAAEDTLQLATETRRTYWRAVGSRETVAALTDTETSAQHAASLAAELEKTGALNKLEAARRQVFVVEVEAQLATARQEADRTAERLTQLVGLETASIADKLPRALPPEPRSARTLGAIEREAMDRRVDLQIGRMEVEALARSYGLTRATHFINVLDAAGISKTQKDRGLPSSDGGGFAIDFQVPLFDFGKANMREAEQRYLEAVNRLAQKVIAARSEVREAYGRYRSARAIVAKYEQEVLPLRQTISEETELQYNAMQVDAFTLLAEARARSAAKVASIEAKRNFWLAYTDLGAAVLGGGSGGEGSLTLAAAAGATND
jgi:outer membrane protein TolC